MRPLRLVLLPALLLSAASVLLFVGLHDFAVSVALERGRGLRGGVGWGLTVQLALHAFAALLLAFNVAALVWPARRVRLALAAWLTFAGLLTLLANPFASWSHPYRYLLLQSCALAGFCLSLAGQSLWSRRLYDPQGPAR